jgi:hypothetical protein
MPMQCNRENMTKLVTALRSGDYQQADGYLKNQGKFCCLGVACDLAAKEGIGSWSGETLFGADVFTDRAGHSVKYGLPSGVAEWLGLDADAGPAILGFGVSSFSETDIAFDGTGPTAAGMNDRGDSFAMIADALTATYLSDEVAS